MYSSAPNSEFEVFRQCSTGAPGTDTIGTPAETLDSAGDFI